MERIFYCSINIYFQYFASGSKNSKSYKFFLDVSDQLTDLYSNLRSNKYVINGILDQGNFNKQGLDKYIDQILTEKAK